MKKGYSVALLAMASAFLFPSLVFATNGYQLIGVGSYQMSLGVQLPQIRAAI